MKLKSVGLKVTKPVINFAWDKRCDNIYRFLRMGISANSTVVKSHILQELYESLAE